MDQSIQYENTILHYRISGTGQKPLLIFHGFGQDRLAFTEFLKKISSDYTIYSFDIFFHGHSEWNQGEKPLEKSYWKKLLSVFLSHHKIDRFSLMGFSLGGKFALASLELFPEKTADIFLLAPDGIKISPWYTLATFTSGTRQLFQSMVLKPERFHWIANLAFRLGFIDKGILRFVESQMNTKEKREQVYFSWVVFRRLKFNLNHIASLINSNNIGVSIYVGKYDKVITAPSMERLLKHVARHKFEILETGHNGLISKLNTL